MFNHKGHFIKLDEATSFNEGGYKVTSKNNMVMKASSVAGNVYSTNSQEAIDMAKQLLDKYLQS